jgi:hypothetical protein
MYGQGALGSAINACPGTNMTSFFSPLCITMSITSSTPRTLTHKNMPPPGNSQSAKPNSQSQKYSIKFQNIKKQNCHTIQVFFGKRAHFISPLLVEIFDLDCVFAESVPAHLIQKLQDEHLNIDMLEFYCTFK